MLLPNGDWRSRRVEVFVSHSSLLTPAEAERQLANGLVTALAGTQFEVYPRHRWTGADICFDRCGLLEAVHGIGSGAYRRFLELVGGHPVGPLRAEGAVDGGRLAVEDAQPEPEAGPAPAEGGDSNRGL